MDPTPQSLAGASATVQITKNVVATLEYTLKNDAGEVLDTSEGAAPLSYVHGAGSLIPGLENELEGKGEGDALQVRIPPEKAYGTHDPDMVQHVSRAQLPDGDLEVGTQFQAESPEGILIVRVVGIEGDRVELDANHPLVDVHLNFDVKVVGVREATAEEIEHGHVHGPGGHQH